VVLLKALTIAAEVFRLPYVAIFLGSPIKIFLTPDVGEDNPIAAETLDISCKTLSYFLAGSSIPISFLIASSAYLAKGLFLIARLNLSNPASFNLYFLNISIFIFPYFFIF